MIGQRQIIKKEDSDKLRNVAFSIENSPTTVTKEEREYLENLADRIEAYLR